MTWARDPSLDERWHLYPHAPIRTQGVHATFTAPCGVVVRKGGAAIDAPDPRLLPGGACQHCLAIAKGSTPMVSIDDLEGAFRAGAAAFRAKLPISSMPEGMPANAWRNGWRSELTGWLETDEGAAFMELVFLEGP